LLPLPFSSVRVQITLVRPEEPPVPLAALELRARVEELTAELARLLGDPGV
jgi:hypothetical protein